MMIIWLVWRRDEILEVIMIMVVFVNFFFKCFSICVFEIVFNVEVVLLMIRIVGFLINVCVIERCCFCFFDKLVVFCVKGYLYFSGSFLINFVVYVKFVVFLIFEEEVWFFFIWIFILIVLVNSVVFWGINLMDEWSIFML